jgi:hypothetical protein
VTARLHERESIMVGIDVMDRLSSVLHSILGSIQAIRFSYEWADISAQPSGKTWKTNYRLNTFEALHWEFLATEYTDAEYKRKLKTFTSRHEKIIKARNNLRKLFVKVGFFLSGYRVYALILFN